MGWIQKALINKDMKVISDKVAFLAEERSPEEFCFYYEQMREDISNIVYKAEKTDSCLRDQEDVKWFLGEALSLYSFLKHNAEKFSKIKPFIPSQKDPSSKGCDVIAHTSTGKKIDLELVFPRDGENLFLKQDAFGDDGVITIQVIVGAERETLGKANNLAISKDEIFRDCLKHFKKGLVEKSNLHKQRKSSPKILLVCVKSNCLLLKKSKPGNYWKKLINSCQKEVLSYTPCQKPFQEIFLITPEGEGQYKCLWKK